MAGFVEGVDRGQLTLLPGSLEDWVDENNAVHVIDAFVEALDLKELGFETVEATGIGRPGYHPSTHLKLYIYGYLHRVQSSRRLEREAPHCGGLPSLRNRGPHREGRTRNPMMNVQGKSGLTIVPVKPSNNAASLETSRIVRPADAD